MVVNKDKCSERVAPPGMWGSFQQHQCNKKAVVERDGKAYCKIHDPEYIKEKKSARQAKWDKETTEQHAMWDLRQARNDATKGLTLQELRRVTPELIRRALGEL